MKVSWRVENWGALRVAGLPCDTVKAMRLERTAVKASELDAAEAALDAIRLPLIDHLFRAIHGCDEQDLRRAMLTLKRRLYNAKTVRADLSEPILTRLPSVLRNGLAELGEAEANIQTLKVEYESTLSIEWGAAVAENRRLMKDDRLLSGLLLSNVELWRTTERLSKVPIDAPLSASDKNREAAIARYVCRAATRTTPFSGFAAVALVSLVDGGVLPSLDLRRLLDCSDLHTWRSVPQVHAGVLRDWLACHLNRSTRANLPLRVTPLRSCTTNPEPTVVFIQATLTPHRSDAPPKHQGIPRILRLSPIVQQIMATADGRSCQEIVEILAESDDEQRHWLDILDHLVECGLLEQTHLRPEVVSTGLRAVASRVENLGDPDAAQRLCGMAEVLESYVFSHSEKRAELLSKMREKVDPAANVIPIYEDVMLEGLTGADLGIEPEVLKKDLLPALALAHACMSDVHHRLLCEAFVTRYGLEGVCTDLPGFLVELLQNDDFMFRLRNDRKPPVWLDSPIVRQIQSTDAACVQLDPALFAELPAQDKPCAVAAFVQLCAKDRLALESGEYQVVLNGMQSGRNKYLSRYLGNGGPVAEAALSSVRTPGLAATGHPLQVELAPILGINFQVHPQLTNWTLETPVEATADLGRVLPLTDLTLRFDASASELRVSSSRLRCDIEPVHFGFLRDENLPDPLLLIRALSPRMREDTIAERIDLYNLLDSWDAARKLPLRRFRPRLEVGRLIVERARWAIPLVEIPLKHRRESHAVFFRTITRWRAEQGLPERGFARRLLLGSQLTGVVTPRTYVDWQNPFSLIGLRRLVLGHQPEPAPNGWLLLTELMPAPEDALLTVNGCRHVSELLIQFEAELNYG